MALPTASRTYCATKASSNISNPKRPPPPALPTSRLSPCWAITVTDKRDKGRTSAAITPSALATITTSNSLAKLAITCTTRLSAALAKRSTFSSNATLEALSKLWVGSPAPYRLRAGAIFLLGTLIRFSCPWLAMVRTVCAASRKAVHDKSSE